MAMRRPRVQYYIDRAGKYRWRYRSVNGDILADSGQGYRDIRDAKHGFELVHSADEYDIATNFEVDWSVPADEDNESNDKEEADQ